MTSPLSLSFLITELHTGGAEKNLVRLAAALAREGHAVRVHALYGDGPLAETLRAAGVPCRVWEIAGWRRAGLLRALAAALRAERPAILHTFLYHANLLGPLLLPWLPGTRLVVSHRGWASAWRFPPEELLETALARIPAAHTVLNLEMQKHWARWAGASRVHPIPNGLTEEELHDPASRPAPAPGTPLRLVAAGQFIPRKDWPTLLTALALLRDRRVPFSCELAGQGTDRPELERLLGFHRLAEQVTLRDFVFPLDPLFSRADLLVTCSRREGCPNVLLEAMGWGLPSVVSDIPGHRELVESSRTGFLFGPGDAKELAGYLELLSHTPPLLRTMGQAAYLRARDEFPFRRQFASHLALYRSLY